MYLLYCTFQKKLTHKYMEEHLVFFQTQIQILLKLYQLIIFVKELYSCGFKKLSNDQFISLATLLTYQSADTSSSSSSSDSFFGIAFFSFFSFVFDDFRAVFCCFVSGSSVLRNTFNRIGKYSQTLMKLLSTELSLKSLQF